MPSGDSSCFPLALEIWPESGGSRASGYTWESTSIARAELDFTRNPGKVMDDITFVRSHWWLVSEGFSLSTANSDVQKLPATL